MLAFVSSDISSCFRRTNIRSNKQLIFVYSYCTSYSRKHTAAGLPENVFPGSQNASTIVNGKVVMLSYLPSEQFCYKLTSATMELSLSNALI